MQWWVAFWTSWRSVKALSQLENASSKAYLEDINSPIPVSMCLDNRIGLDL